MIGENRIDAAANGPSKFDVSPESLPAPSIEELWELRPAQGTLTSGGWRLVGKCLPHRRQVHRTCGQQWFLSKGEARLAERVVRGEACVVGLSVRCAGCSHSLQLRCLCKSTCAAGRLLALVCGVLSFLTSSGTTVKFSRRVDLGVNNISRSNLRLVVAHPIPSHAPHAARGASPSRPESRVARPRAACSRARRRP